MVGKKCSYPDHIHEVELIHALIHAHVDLHSVKIRDIVAAKHSLDIVIKQYPVSKGLVIALALAVKRLFKKRTHYAIVDYAI
jgi:hypothetical protein